MILILNALPSEFGQKVSCYTESMLKLLAYCIPFPNILIKLPCYELCSLDSLISALLKFLMLCRWTCRELYLFCMVWPNPKLRLKSWTPPSHAFWACTDSMIYRTSLFTLRSLAAAQTVQLSLREKHDFFTYINIVKQFSLPFLSVGFVALLWPSGMVQYIWKSTYKYIQALNVARLHTRIWLGSA